MIIGYIILLVMFILRPKMDNEELLKIYLERLKSLSLEQLYDNKVSVMEALKASLNYLEGEMKGY